MHRPTLRHLICLLAFLCITLPCSAQDSASLTGQVIDSDDGSPLFGANVLLNTPDGTIIQGVVADPDGRFQMTDIPPGDYTLNVSYVAYVGFDLSFSLTTGEVRTINAVLTRQRVNINSIVVTASRGEEKVLDSPASITIVHAEDVKKDVGYSTISTLRNVTGVDLAQTSLDRNQISLRGFNAANINSNVFLLNDYRPALGSEGVAFYSIMSSSAVDLDRIEVVRGPASALYGAGGDAGVVHFISKNPFDHPGTTMALTGGTRSTIAGQYRHAGLLNSSLGYKLNATYKQADEWEYNPEDAVDAAFLSQEVAPRTTKYSKTILDGMLQYRSGRDLTMTLNGGFSELTGYLLTDLSPFQVAQMLGYYGQFRVQAGNFFGQVYANMREAGESFSYTAVRPIVQEGGRYGGQLQFDHTGASGENRFIFGLDADLIRLESSGTLTGRNEDVDDLTLLGGYAQTSVNVSEQFDITFALRGDWSNVYEGLQLSPRAAMVYKPSPKHTIRTSYNSAFAAPTTFQFYLDFVIQEQTLTPEGAQFLVLGRGSADPFTFNTFRSRQTARMALPVGNYFGADIDVNQIPISPILGAAVGAGLPDLIRMDDPAQGLSLNLDQRALLADLLLLAASPSLFDGVTTSAGVLGIPDNSPTGFREVTAPADTRPLEQTTTQLFEVGYKGIYTSNILLTLDVYYANKKNFVTPLSIVTPFVYLDPNTVSGDLSNALSTLLSTSSDPAVVNILDALLQSGLSVPEISSMLSGMVGQAMTGQPVAAVQTDQAILASESGNAVAGMATFQSFGDIDYWGADLSIEYYPHNRFSVFTNVSLISDDLFDNKELNETDTSLELALNAPTFKAKLGASYTFPSGFSLTGFGRFARAYPVRSGTLVGEVDETLLFDLGVGYDFYKSVPGLRVDVMVQNVANDLHRQFVGAPEIGRMALARLTYTIE